MTEDPMSSSRTRMDVVPLSRPFAADICTWRYPAPYDCYDMTDADPDDLVQPERGFFAVVQEGALVGFRSFGHDGRVPGWPYDDAALDTGGGLRPEITGRGLGRHSIAAGLAFGRAHFAPPAFRVTVAAFNSRALRTVAAMGFQPLGSFDAATDGRAFEVLLRPETRTGDRGWARTGTGLPAGVADPVRGGGRPSTTH